LPVWRSFLQRVRRDRGGWAAELHCRNALGETLQVEVKAALVVGVQGEVVLATLRGLSSREDMQARIAELAYHDALTGLPNRVLLRDRLEMALARSQRGGSRGVVLMLDTDNFKTINDSLGHSTGDRLLQELAGRIIKALHQDDTVARLGGDEFVVLPQLMDGETAVVLEHALAVVDQLRSALDRPFRLDGHDVHITVSVGVAVYPNDGNTVDELLRRADSAMYQAKATGRNATHFYSPELEEGVARRLTMGSALRRALVNEEFVLDFQPQLALADKTLVGCEALVRWERPGHGRVPPLDFLPYLEELGLLTELGFWVLDRACQYWREGRDQGVVAAHFRMAVNISAGQFASPAFVQMVQSVLEDNDMPGCNLELEITEQALVSDLANAASKITTLQAQGVSFAIDDFGTGYSSLAYLQQLPVDCLKIDRGFVKLIGKGDRSAGLVDVIISIARKLNLRVVAEGIEHNSQAAYLAQHGCDFGQGYLFGRPVSWAQLHGIDSNSQLRLLD
jgi:diguanylate cyclase (GGDEF)-like protein